MKIGLIFSISKTHLLSRKKQSITAAMGVMFGIGTYVIMMGFMEGLNGLLDGLILNRTPHIHLFNEVAPSAIQPIDRDSIYHKQIRFVNSIKPKKVQAKIHNALPLIAYLNRQTSVLGITPQVKVQTFYLGGSTQLNGVIIGADVEKEKLLYNLSDYIVKGTVEDLKKTEKGILLGAGVAKKLALNVGDFIQVTSKTGEIITLKIVGFFQSGMSEIDNVQSYVNLKTAQRIFGESKNYITDVNIKLKDIEMAPQIAKNLSQKFGVTATDIQTANAQFETGSTVRTLISYAVSITLLIVAGFGIYNILNMMIFEKMNDIAILKATGFSGLDVQWIFMSQAIIIGLVGGMAGLLLGYGVSVIIDNTSFDTPALPTIKTYPIDYSIKFYFIGVTFALISTFFAGWFPSRKAKKIDPVDIIRGQ
jgi:lipoprotein-releasing system permease protein